MKKKHTTRSIICNLRILTALFSVCALIFLALFAAANTSTHGQAVRAAGVTRRTFMRVTPQGVIQSTHIDNSKSRPAVPKIAQRRGSGPLGNTLWHYDDPTAIADGVSIGPSEVWGAWTLSGARLTTHAITGNGTPDWSFQYPVSDPNLPAGSRKVAMSGDGNTIAAVVSDSVTQNSTLYIFDAFGQVLRTWTDPLRMDGVDLTDDGQIALVTQDNQATVFVISSTIRFSVAGSGAGNIFYPINGDGRVFAVGGFNFDVYSWNGTTYNRVIHFTRPNFWFGGASTVSLDGSTVGTFGANYANGWLSGEVYLFDVASGNMLGSYPVRDR